MSVSKETVYAGRSMSTGNGLSSKRSGLFEIGGHIDCIAWVQLGVVCEERRKIL